MVRGASGSLRQRSGPPIAKYMPGGIARPPWPSPTNDSSSMALTMKRAWKALNHFWRVPLRSTNENRYRAARDGDETKCRLPANTGPCHLNLVSGGISTCAAQNPAASEKSHRRMTCLNILAQAAATRVMPMPRNRGINANASAAPLSVNI